MIIYTIRNEKTGRQYQVDENGWAAIEKQGWASRFVVVDKRQLTDPAKTTFLPKEIAEEASAAAAKAIAEGLKGTDAGNGDKR